MTTRFVDRDAELAALEASWRAEPAQLLVVLGRRRIGKTALLREFARSHPSIVHFVATRLPEPQQLAELGEAIGATIGDPILAENGFRDWKQVVSILAPGRSRLALIIDEFPYLVDANPALPSLLQRAWDDTLTHGHAWIALCGSSVAMMERETLDARAPLFGRRTGHLRLQPLPFDAVPPFAPGWTFDQCVETFAVFGGVPQYLQLIDAAESLVANIDRLVAAPAAPLRDEVEFLLRQELVDTRVYFGVLSAIAAGHHKFGEIVNATHLPAGHVTKYLSVLQTLGLVTREVPATEARPEKSKRGLYRIADPFVRFWFRHVRRHWSRLETGHRAAVVRDIQADLEYLAQGAYEDLCRDSVARRTWPGFHPWVRTGRWWNATAEIDVVAVDEQGAVLAGEATWSRRPVGTNVLNDLEDVVARTGIAAHAPRTLFAICSRSGFTPGLQRLARERDDVVLVERLEFE